MLEGADVEIPMVCVRWEVNTQVKPSLEKRIRSSEFRFLKSEWSLSFHFRNDTHHLRLELDSQECCCALFNISVHVEGGGTERILPQLSRNERCEAGFLIPENNDDYGSYVWQKTDEEIQSVYPEWGENYYKLRFLVVLKKREVLTDTISRETQTECSVPEAAGQSSSTISTSVKTTLLQNANPCFERLSEDLAQLMVQGSDHDVEFQCGGQSTKAHKLIVCQRSSVIASMLDSDMVEGRTGVVKIPDMEPDIFAQFLRYVYSGQLEELTFEVALRLFEAGDQYAVHGLANRCSEFLLEHLSVDNAYEVLVVADAHSNKDFVERVVDYMVDHRLPLVSEAWSTFCDEHPKLATTVLNRGWKVLVK